MALLAVNEFEDQTLSHQIAYFTGCVRDSRFNIHDLDALPLSEGILNRTRLISLLGFSVNILVKQLSEQDESAQVDYYSMRKGFPIIGHEQEQADELLKLYGPGVIKLGRTALSAYAEKVWGNFLMGALDHRDQYFRRLLTSISPLSAISDILTPERALWIANTLHASYISRYSQAAANSRWAWAHMCRNNDYELPDHLNIFGQLLKDQ